MQSGFLVSLSMQFKTLFSEIRKLFRVSDFLVLECFIIFSYCEH